MDKQQKELIESLKRACDAAVADEFEYHVDKQEILQLAIVHCVLNAARNMAYEILMESKNNIKMTHEYIAKALRAMDIDV